MKKMEEKVFIERSTMVHEKKYDYSKVKYVNVSQKICIICPEHGEFWQTPKAHMDGQGCPKCGILSRSKLRRCGLDIFKKKSIDTHGIKYDYSKVEYLNNRTKVCIICPEHGEFWQAPSCHIGLKQGCPNCGNKKISVNKTSTLESFIRKATNVHKNKYDYSKVEYHGLRGKIDIICPVHGKFQQTAGNHLSGHGCPSCSGLKMITEDEFIMRSIKVHKNKYDYSKVKCTGNHRKVCIICPEHGEFWQAPSSHIAQKQGCPVCSESKLERRIRLLLLENNIDFIPQYRSKWLGRQSLDFYLPNHNIAIECQGEQHFIEKDFFGGKDGLKGTLLRDQKKKNLCIQNGVKLIYFTNVDSSLYKGSIFKVYENENEILKEINILL